MSAMRDREEKGKKTAGAVLQKRRRNRSALFLLPSFAGTGLFFLFPFLAVLYFSVLDSPIRRRFVFLDNYKALFTNDTFLRALGNTTLFSLEAVPAAVLLSLGLAVLLDGQVFGKSRIRSSFLSAMTVPSACVLLIFRALFDRQGTVNGWLAALGLEGVDWMHSYASHFAVLLFFLWKNIGYFMILFLAALSGIPRAALEAAELESAGGWQIFWHIKLRYLSSTLFFVTILALVNSFKVFREVYLLEGPYPHKSLYLLQHFMNNTFRSLDYQKVCAAAVILSTGIVAVLLLLFLLERRAGKDVEA